jgi:hypothetical protein
MKLQFGAAIVAAALLGLPAAASADPPITPPGASTCTFQAGLTTCVERIGFASVQIVQVSDPSCPSGMAERRTSRSSTLTTTTIFRGMRKLSETQTEETSGPTVTTTCIPPDPVP